MLPNSKPSFGFLCTNKETEVNASNFRERLTTILVVITSSRDRPELQSYPAKNRAFQDPESPWQALEWSRVCPLHRQLGPEFAPPAEALSFQSWVRRSVSGTATVLSTRKVR